MNQVAQDRSLTAGRIDSFISEARRMPQISCEEKHYFGPNIYIREVVMPAGAVIVGKPHKTDHMCNMISGRMILVKDDGERVEIVAPQTFMATKGRKIAYILETVRFQNIFSTDETDIEKLENMLVDNTQPLLEQGK